MLLQIAQSIFRRRLTSTIALPSVLLLLFSGVSLWQVNRLLAALEWVDHTDQVIAQAYQTHKLLLDIQTGSRGYIITGKPEFLEPYQEATPTTNTAFRKLKDLVSDNPIQVQRVQQLQLQYQEWSRLISQGVELRQEGKVEPLSAFEVRKQKMDAIRQQMADFVATEVKLRDQRSQTARDTAQQVSVTSIILALVIGITLTYYIRRQIFKVSQTYENALKTATEKTENAQLAAQRLTDLHKIDRAILAAEPDVTIIRNGLGRLRQLINCQQAFSVLFNFETNTAEVLAAHADGELQLAEGTTLPITDFVLGEVRQTPQIFAATNDNPPIIKRLLAGGLNSCITIPMQVEDAVIGEIILVKSPAKNFSTEVLEIAQEVSAQLAIAIKQSQLRQELKDYASKLEHRVSERTAQLQAINQDLEAFNYSVSHDLRAPLRTMQGFAQALLEDYNDQLDSFGQDCLNYIAEGAMQMDTLITDLLSYSRLSRSQILIQPVDLNVVIKEALKQLDAQIKQQQAQIQINYSLPQVLAHRPTLVQVVTNLLNNAIKFVQPDRQPIVQIYSQEYNQQSTTWVKLWIVDNGIGIAPEHQERIFRVFERLHGIEAYPGTGIGLAIVRKSLEKMGGFCGVESQLGTGSRFWIALPKVVFDR
ncbi:CHASE3 domain-containing protein [Nostoc sp. FACHB-152]|uniref:CHASE3 domain-containing protein n=1 Tax=unclassified Nostoc TaxID=2593658 RepID=UPI00168868F1|nr:MULTISPECIES: CHASE3 domain-containing protein [unclassified Nostoc]MBD2448518.1 CHASE3 domain-containing protein [Nostoc sp. FACHB-152]MBD2466255.1 CHASE3 domain-containing protein [Nostoc sp. FACHB-145]